MANKTSIEVSAEHPLACVDAAISPDTADTAKSPVRNSSLSPSRAADFKICPLLYRLRCVDRIPEPPSTATARGTLVHAVLEKIFDHPAHNRVPDNAVNLVTPLWEELSRSDPEIAALFPSPEALEGWLISAQDLVRGYFSLEDPRRLEPAEREISVEATLDSGVLLRGIIDRMDISPSGAIRIVDYKTGASPREAFEAKALFQLKFYALVIWRARGIVPTALRLVYLADKEILDYFPDERELERFEQMIAALWAAIGRCFEKQDFKPNPSKLCNWCPHQHLCPAHGGTPPPFPTTVASTVGA